MNKKKLNILDKLRFLPVVIVIIFIIIYIVFGDKFTVQTILKYSPKSKFLVALFLLLLYILKSISIFFPIAVLNVACGIIFSPFLAVCMSLLGAITDLSVSYCVGKFLGKSFSLDLYNKYPKLKNLVSDKKFNERFLAFILRVIILIPVDVISMYFGTKQTKFSSYLIFSFLGVFLRTISETLLGIGITDPKSPIFWISILMNIGLSIISIVGYYYWNKKNNIND